MKNWELQSSTNRGRWVKLSICFLRQLLSCWGSHDFGVFLPVIMVLKVASFSTIKFCRSLGNSLRSSAHLTVLHKIIILLKNVIADKPDEWTIKISLLEPLKVNDPYLHTRLKKGKQTAFKKCKILNEFPTLMLSKIVLIFFLV